MCDRCDRCDSDLLGSTGNDWRLCQSCHDAEIMSELGRPCPCCCQRLHGGFCTNCLYLDEYATHEAIIMYQDAINDLSTNHASNDDSSLVLLKTMHFKRRREDETTTCVICLENVKNRQYVADLRCRHIFHASCLKTWVQYKSECPICKLDV